MNKSNDTPAIGDKVLVCCFSAPPIVGEVIAVRGSVLELQKAAFVPGSMKDFIDDIHNGRATALPESIAIDLASVFEIYPWYHPLP